MNFDTHKYVKYLTTKGLKVPQAESIIEAINQSRGFDFSNLVTKDQLNAVEERLSSRIIVEVTELRGEMKEGFASVKYYILKWIMPFLIVIIFTILFKH